MTDFVNIVLKIVFSVSIIGAVLFMILGLFDSIMTLEDFKKLLKKLRIPLSYNQGLILGIVFIILAGISYILIAKMSGRL